MDKLAYTAFSGMRASLAAQSVTANNIANSSTTGFRRDFSATVAAAVEARGTLEARILSQSRENQADMSEGTLIATGRPLDVAVSSGSFLTVQAEDGSEAYTRRGDLTVAPSGLLVNGEGHPIAGEGGPITVPPASRIEIGADGTIAIQARDARPGDELEQIGKLKLVTPEDPAQLKRLPSGLFTDPAGGLAGDPAARVVTGQLEGSNVNMAAELVNLTEQARQFELQVGLLTASRDLDQASASLMRNE